MRCVFCNSPETKVIDSRLAGEGQQIRRRRECEQCAGRFTTYETAEPVWPRVVKRDHTRTDFDLSKLRGGVMRALEKRPVSTAATEAALEEIARKVRAWQPREIDSRQLGDWAMEILRKLDQVAYVRFASVYRSFEDVSAFRDVVKDLEQGLTPEQMRSQMPLIEED